MPPTRLHRTTGRLQHVASLTSSIICPIESSTEIKAFTLSAAAFRISFGNGQSVIGRISPTFIPFFLASTTAFFETRAAIPKATTQ